MTNLQLKKSLLSWPGDTIKEHVEYIGMSQVELAKQLGTSIHKLITLIKGKATITKETATKLEDILDIPASFWINLESIFQNELFDLKMMNKSLL